MSNKENIQNLESAINRLETSDNNVYFLTYDTKGNARAAVKHIYDIALTLKENGIKSKILVEEKNYGGVDSWLGDKYKDLEVVSIKEDNVHINIDDIIVVPEYYSNVLDQLSNIKCVKVMLIQQRELMYETLSVGSRWSDFGFDKVITTNAKTKKYIAEYFPVSLIHIIPPIIDDVFSPTTSPIKPFVAISCRDRVKNRKFISEFYLKYPQLRWITFRDMVQMSYSEFASALKECMVSFWVDDISTFGTFPLESMKCDVPVVGKIPSVEPDWLSENGMWAYDESKLVDILGTYILAWLEGIELTSEVREKMRETLIPYKEEVTKNNILSVFNSFNNKRTETIKSALEKIKTEETV
jgi:glycosyltransferase involved in cell wall biosynthesis